MLTGAFNARSRWFLTAILLLAVAVTGCGLRRVPSSYVPKRPFLTEEEVFARWREAQSSEYFQGQAAVTVSSGILEKSFPARFTYRAPDLVRVDASLGGMLGILDAEVHLFRRRAQTDLYVVRAGDIAESHLLEEDLLRFLGVEQLPAGMWGLVVGRVDMPDTLSTGDLEVTQDGQDYLASYGWGGWSRTVRLDGITGLPVEVEDREPGSTRVIWTARFLRESAEHTERAPLSVRVEQAERRSVLQIDYRQTDTSTHIPEELFTVESLAVAEEDLSSVEEEGKPTEGTDQE